MDYSKIETLRKVKKLSKAELFRISGVKDRTYYDLMEGNTDPKITTIEKLSNALGVSPAIWWNDNIEPIVEEPAIHYEKKCSNCERLKQQLYQQQDHIDLLMAECRRKKKHPVG